MNKQMRPLAKEVGSKRVFRPGNEVPYHLQKRRLIEAFNHFQIETTFHEDSSSSDDIEMVPDAAPRAAIEEEPKKEGFTLVVGSLRLELPSIILKQGEELLKSGKTRLIFTEPGLRKELLKSSLRHCLSLAKNRGSSNELSQFI